MYYGKIPESWVICKFGEIVNICRGASPRPIKEHLTFDSDGIPWIKIGDTKPGDIYIERTAQRIKKESAKHSVYLKAGSLILSNSMSFGRPYILKINGCIHDGWLAIETFDNTINLEFLQYLLQGYMWFFKSKATGTGVDNLNIDRVKEMPFALPPLKEQKRILERLLEFDKIINQINQYFVEIKRDASLIKSKILDNIFGNDSSYKSYYAIREGELYTFCESITKGSTPTTYGFKYIKEGINFIKVENISDGKILDNINCHISEEAHDYQKRSQLKENDILYSIAGTIGKTCIVTKNVLPANTNQAFAIISGFSSNIMPEYLFYYLLWVSGKEGLESHGGGMNNATLGGLKKLFVWFPKKKEDQQTIVDKIKTAFMWLNVIRD